ncbi:MAG: cation diffusion facilitator family transporter [Betaproteobacteria bacterium]
MASGSTRAVLYALSANFGIFLAKAVAAALTGSSAMLAEAIHSFADCGNQGLLLRGMREAKRAPDQEHPLGYGSVVYFWAFLVAVLLFTVGGAFSIYEGAHKLIEPEPMTRPFIAIGVLIVAIFLEAGSLLGCIREIRKVFPNGSLWQFFREGRDSDLIVVLGEDIAALAGLCVALIAVGVTLATGNPMFDALGSIAVGVLLILVAVLLAVEIKAMITGQSAARDLEDQMRSFITARPEVAELFNLISLQRGNDIMLAVKARMRETERAAVLVEDINRVEAALKQAFPQIEWLFFEPDSAD